MDPTTFALRASESYVRDAICLPSETRLRLLGWIRSKSIAKLATACDAFPECIASREQWRTLLQVEAFFSKNAAFSDSNVCLAKARDSFQRAERICRITNKRLDYYYAHRNRLGSDMRFWLDRAERWIDITLGEYEVFMEQIPIHIRVTSGATALASRRKSVPFLKISRNISATVSAFPYLQALSRYFGYGDLSLRETNFNRIEVVPKSWKTHRTIACEPTGNLPLQLAFDAFAKDRLRKRGIDLSDQGRNQRLATQGSVDDSYATLDMSMASDTVSLNAVSWLFPFKWLKYLLDIRANKGESRFDGFSTEYAKFSSMGNGATFAIETLIFSACCHAVGSKDFSVYGDDIVIETEFVPNLLRMLKFLGFLVNKEKSHISGPFRESCGISAFNGIDITPAYVRGEKPCGTTLVHYINTLAAIAVPEGLLWEFLRAQCSKELLRVPFNEDTRSGIWIDHSHARATGILRTTLRNRSELGCTQLAPLYSPWYRGYTLEPQQRRNFGERSLFLWFLDKKPGVHSSLPYHGWMGRREWRLYQALYEKSGVVRTCAVVPGPGVKTRKSWHPLRWSSLTSQPVHIILWTEYLKAPKGP